MQGRPDTPGNQRSPVMDNQDYCKVCGHAIYKSTKDGKEKHATQDGEKAAEKDGHEVEGPEEEQE